MRNELIDLLTNEFIRKIFQIIARERRISFGNLLEMVHVPNENVGVAIESLEKLKNLNLIDESKTPLKEWNTYFITATGLSAERTLNRLLK